MIQLKQYQEDALDTLNLYLSKVAELGDARKAFIDSVYEKFEENRDYKPISGFNKDMPYICLRLPTGGGKTILACHSIKVARDNLLNQDNACVLWLVPSDTIKVQTINALKDYNHPYRKALVASLGNIEVREPNECYGITKATLDGANSIIVSTLQAFRIANKDGRKAYSDSGALMSNFSGIDRKILDKLSNDGEEIEYSLANVLRMRHPIIIVDEAHNARTELSFDMLKAFEPSAIIEFTATPSKGDKKNLASNVLHHVSARELYSENMIKLPIQLEVKSNWKDTLHHAIAKLDVLGELAKIEHIKTKEYIRPIMLIKAQNREEAHPENITVDIIKPYLVQECNIPENEIAIEAYGQSESKGKDLTDKNCKIRYIITVDSLKEGWDCPWAYVLCSLANQHSETAVEQLLGRILRLPKASRKALEALNCAYAYTVSDNFLKAANALKDSLVSSGFNAMDAEDFVKPAIQESLALPTPFKAIPSKVCALKTNINTALLPEELSAKIEYIPQTKELKIKQVCTNEEIEQIQSIVEDTEDKASIEDVIIAQRTQVEEIFSSPAERNLDFRVPTLGIVIQGEFELFEAETQIFDIEWNILDYKDADLNFAFNPNIMEDKTVLADLDEEGKIALSFTKQIQSDLQIITPLENWDTIQLVSWLDRNIEHSDIDKLCSNAFITHILLESIERHNASLTDFVKERWAFLKHIREIFSHHRANASKSAFDKQLELLIATDEYKLDVSDEENSLVFNPDIYPVNSTMENIFEKHYFNQVGILNDEEIECARFIDSLDEVEFWIRNLERKAETSFWLPIANGKFYPDFVCKLKDGRIFVIEYKGEHLLANKDTQSKNTIGELWANYSKGKCLFLLAQKSNFKAKISEMVK